MNVWLGIKHVSPNEAIELVSGYCSNHDEVEESFVIEYLSCADWVLLKVYFSDACYDVIYPEEFAEASSGIEDLFIARCFEGSASAQVLEVFKNGRLELKLDLMNEEGIFSGAYKKYEPEYADVQSIIGKDQGKDDSERSEMQALISKLYPELNSLNQSSIFGIFDGLFNAAKKFCVVSPSGTVMFLDEALDGYEDHEIEYQGDTLFSWGG